MKKTLFLIALIALVLSTGCQSLVNTDSSIVETEWMPLEQLNIKLGELEKKENGKNFWDHGHWIMTADGRWKNGIPEYKISYGAVPESSGYWWYWWFNQPQESFQKHVHQMADKGFTLVHYQSFERPGGDVRYQGVWHKIEHQPTK